MKPNPRLSALRHEIPVLLEAARAGSKKGSLLSLCEELAPLLSMTAPATLRQQWLRWTAGAPRLRLVSSGSNTAPKTQQVPTLDNLTRIYKEAVERGWIKARVSNAEELCDFLVDESARRQAEMTDRIRRRRKAGVNAFVDGLVLDFLCDDAFNAQLWQTLPVGIGETLSTALVKSLRKRLVFVPPITRRYESRREAAQAQNAARRAKARAYNGHAKADVYAASASMLKDIAENFAYQLAEYAEEILAMQAPANAEYHAAAIEAERAEFDEMVANAQETIADEEAARGLEFQAPRKNGPFKADSDGRWVLKKKPPVVQQK